MRLLAVGFIRRLLLFEIVNRFLELPGALSYWTGLLEVHSHICLGVVNPGEYGGLEVNRKMLSVFPCVWVFPCAWGSQAK